jgi:hypothetical protein
MKRCLSIATLACIVGANASAAPVMLLCVTENPATVRGVTYQIVFDEAAQVVTRDAKKPVRARITDTLISWSEVIQFGTEQWTVDRLSGAWRIQIEKGARASMENAARHHPGSSRSLIHRASCPGAQWRCIVACRTGSTAGASPHRTAGHPSQPTLRRSEGARCGCGRTDS